MGGNFFFWDNWFLVIGVGENFIIKIEWRCLLFWGFIVEYFVVGLDENVFFLVFYLVIVLNESLLFDWVYGCLFLILKVFK